MERKPYSGSDNRSRSSAPSGRSGSASRSNVPASRNYSSSQNRYSSVAHRPRTQEYERDYGRSAYEDRRRPIHAAPYEEPHRRRPPRPEYYGNTRRRSRRKSSWKRFLWILIALLALVGLICTGVYHTTSWLTVNANSDTYCANVFVNGINLDNYTQEEGIQAVQNQLDARINALYTLSAQGETWTFTPADFNAAIDIQDFLDRAWSIGHVGGTFDRKKDIESTEASGVEFNASMVYDESLIDGFLQPIAQALYLEPVNATVLVDVQQPLLSGQSSKGQQLDMAAAHDLIVSMIENSQYTGELPLLAIEPAISSDAALGGLSLIVEYSTDTSFRGLDSRKNVEKALSYFNAYTVHPGDTVNFNDVVGPRTIARGFREAPEYVGNRSETGVGGGVCQASSTLYGAVLMAGMDVIKRSNHSMTVSYCEPSLDAAVIDNDRKNLVFTNNTEHTIYIYTHVDKENATVKIYGNRPAYRYELHSEIISQDSECRYKSYIPDLEGKYCRYTHETKLHSEGHPALKSNGYLISYDWETGEEVARKRLSRDNYESGTNIYWRGIIDAATNEVVDYSEW